jgi:toxin ParE1/3/4
MDIEWTNRALADIDGIRAFIAKDNRLAAVDTVDLIIITVQEYLPGEPEIGRPGRIGGTRELIIPHSSYVVPYRVRRYAQ